MLSTSDVFAPATDRPGAIAGSGDSDPRTLRKLGVPVRRAIGRTRQWLLDQQLPDGAWCAELEGDCLLESETILLWAFLGREESDEARQAAEYLLERQLPTGGWAMYPGGEIEVSGSVKAYFALKLTGHDPGAEYMQRARSAILARGGADAVNSYTRFFLAMLGQISYEHCPAVPPELVLLPKWFPISLYRVSAWSRTIIVPLSIVSALRPVRTVAPDRGIRELFLREPEAWPPLHCPGRAQRPGTFSWDRFFRGFDKLLKWCQRHRLTPLRRRAIKAARRWMRTRFQRSDGLGAIYPPIVWSIVALKALGCEDDSPELLYNFRQIEALILRDENRDTLRLQPCKSPVWDTAITLRALSAGGIRPDDPAVGKAVAWLVDRQIRRPGDWAETVSAPPGGWCFEWANDFYPDCDDTAMTLLALKTQFENPPPETLPPPLRVFHPDALSSNAPRWQSRGDNEEEAVVSLDAVVQAVERGQRWLTAMQNDDGGWGAFDRNNNTQFLCAVPFADHNAMIDPSTPDLTGRVLEALGALGRRLSDPQVARAVDYIRRTQEPDGSWFGRWGVNYIYGTWQAIIGLRAVGVPTTDPAVVAGANWLLAHQQACGGWGESPETYDHPHLRGQGTPTASQTAWAVLGLLAAGMARHPAVIQAVRFLTQMQNEDGTWEEPEFTGTGFPRVFYLKYHYYPIYFPLMALAQWAVQSNPGLADNELPMVRKKTNKPKPAAAVYKFPVILARSS
ncbi:MAG: squalene--hopene cyclase [Pirellulales bacterium]|nr:squalene--hopene cyclase [Pirellulales bacterium]